MPRSRSRKKRDGRRARGARLPDSFVLIDLLGELDRAGLDDRPAADVLLLDAFERAAWSFHAGPGPAYAGPGSLDRSLAGLRAREWFLFEFELPSGLTAAEEWIAQREGEPGSGADRRAVQRFLNSECGVFDVHGVRPDGWMLLVPLAGGDNARARTIDSAAEMLPGSGGPALPVFQPGNTLAGRLYWRDDDRAELSAGTCLVSPEVRARLLADPPAPSELRSGLALEALLGADPSTLLGQAADPCFPNLVDGLLGAVSDGTFGYRRLWRELEGEGDPVAVTRQLLSELLGWTDVEPQLLAWAVAGAWLRRREAAAGRPLAPEALSRDRRALEDHVRTVLDTPAESGWPVPAPGTALAISEDAAIADIDDLEVGDVEWVVDVRPHPGASHTSAGSAILLSCAIVEQPIGPFDGLEVGALGERGDPGEDGADAGEDDEEIPYGYDDEGEDEELFGDEDEDPFGDDDEEGLDEEGLNEYADEDAPLMLRDAVINEGEDEATVALEALVETLLAEGRTARPRCIVFRQRALAARLGDTLRDAGLDVALRCFDEAVDVATLDFPEGDEQATPVGTPRAADVPRASEAERRAYERLADAARRAQEGLDILASVTAPHEEPALAVTLARPLAISFTTFEGIEEQVASIAVVAENAAGRLLVRLYPAAPGAGSRFECRGPAGDLLIDAGDSFEIEIGEPNEGNERRLREVRAAGVVSPDGDSDDIVVPLLARDGTMPVLLRGRDLEVAAGLMEAVASAAERIAEDGPEDPGAIETRVDPLGDVKVEWRGWL